MAQKPFFEYPPIPLIDGCNFIRLVELKPGQTAEGLLEVVLHFADLSDDDGLPQYEALSYVWGSPAAGRTGIICNGRYMSITDTLGEALLHLAPSAVDGSSRMLWIDQIAINQEDDVEKSAQVALMDKIFRQSFQTIAWLGHGNEKTERAFRVMMEVTLDATRERELPTTSTTSRLQAEASYRDFIKGFESVKAIGLTDLRSVTALLRKPWFTRMWILQEAVIPRRVVLQCSDQQIDLDIFLFALTFMIMSPKTNFGIHFVNTRYLVTLSNLRQIKQDDERLSLQNLLTATCCFQATDPRDRFHALYGLTSTDLDLMRLKPDYTRNLTEVYSYITHALIKQSGNLHLLELTGLDIMGKESRTPSWTLCEHPQPPLVDHFVQGLDQGEMIFGPRNLRALLTVAIQREGVDPDELEPGEMETMINEILEEDDELPDLAKPLYLASGDSKLTLLEFENGALKLHGQLVDKIDSTAGVLFRPQSFAREYETDIDNAETFKEVWTAMKTYFKKSFGTIGDYTNTLRATDEMVQQRATRPYPTGESVTAAFGKTLTAGSRVLSEDADQAFQDYRDLFVRKGVERSLPLPFGMSIKSATSTLSLLASGGRKVPQTALFAQLMHISNGRRVAWTHKGYLSLIPARAQRGDVVAILKGGRLPFVLRHVTKGWQVVGPCYVHGIMEGEAFDPELCGEVRLV